MWHRPLFRGSLRSPRHGANSRDSTQHKQCGRPLVQHLAECNEGDELILEYKRKGIKGYIEVLPVNGVSSIEVGDEEENDGVPDIDLDDDEKESGNSKGKGDDEADIQIPDTL
jgi:hypothetical protein